MKLMYFFCAERDLLEKKHSMHALLMLLGLEAAPVVSCRAEMSNATLFDSIFRHD